MSEDASNFDAVEAGPRASDPAMDTRSGTAGLVAEHSSVVAMRERFGDAVHRHEVNSGDQHVVFIAPERNAEILGWLKNDPDQRYDFLADVTGVDYGGGRPVHLVYQLWSNEHKRVLRVKCELALEALSVESVTGIWNGANWLEREVYDLFGIEFRGHPDLRRILMPDDYAEGHPLRKDFPLRGRFSRAEQTRRALNPDVHHHYFEAELEMGGAPMLPEGQVEGDFEDATAVVDDFGLGEEE